MIDLKHIAFTYPQGPAAIVDATARMAAGIRLLLGPNGSGKTTLMQLIASVLKPDSGECLIDSADMEPRRPSTLQRVFYLAEDCQMPLPTLRDMVRLHAPFYPGFSLEAFEANIAAFGLTGREPLLHMSLGQRKRSNVAYALSLGADVLLLDEPANGLDIESKRTLRRLIAANYQEDKTIIVATHTVHDLQNLFDSVTILDRGIIVLSESIADLEQRLAFVVGSEPFADALYAERDVAGWHAIVPGGEHVTPIDFELLYSAMTGPWAAKLATYLTNSL